VARYSGTEVEVTQKEEGNTKKVFGRSIYTKTFSRREWVLKTTRFQIGLGLCKVEAKNMK